MKQFNGMNMTIKTKFMKRLKLSSKHIRLEDTLIK